MDDDIWSFKIIDMDKTGFARYCPTFVSAYDRIKNYFRIRKYVKENALSDGDKDVRESVAEAFGNAVSESQDITPAVPALADALSDEDKSIRQSAASALRDAAENGQNITPAVPALANALSDKVGFVRWLAASALEKAAENGQNITPAVPALINALNNKDNDVRKSAASALTAHYRNKKNWKKLGELLGHENKYFRESAALTLRTAAERGQDITPAIPALGNALGGRNRSNAAEVLTHHYTNKGEWNKIEELLKHEDVRRSAVWALKEAAKDGKDITLAIPALANTLSDENENIRCWAAEALEYAAKRGQDITPAVPALGNALSDGDKYIRRHVAEAFVNAISESQDITPAVPALADALNDKDDDIIFKVAWLLRTAAKRGQDITPAIPALINALGDESAVVEWYATDALAYHYVNNGEWNKIEGLLKHKNRYVRRWTAEALAEFVKEYESLEKLKECQRIVESSFADWMKIQRPGPSPEKSRMQAQISRLLIAIGKKKAELSKKEWDLLLGETVKKPNDKDKKIYRNLRRVGRNG